MADARRVLRRVDPVLAAALLGVSLYALWALPASESDFVAPPAADAAFLVAVCVPLAWRGRYPLPVFAVVLGTTWIWLLLFYGDQPQPPYPPAVALLLATFSAAAVPRTGSAWAVATALGAFLVSTDVPAVLAGRAWGDVVPSWVLFTLAFAVGRAVGLRAQQAAAAADRASAAEAGRAEDSARAAAAERVRIARELHDVVTHAVTVMVVQAAAEGRAVPSGTTTHRVLADIEAAGREALAELRRMLGVLRAGEPVDDRRPPPSLRELDALLDAARGGGLDVSVEVRGEPAELPAALDLAAYRIVQEALTNVRKHGSGGTAVLHVDHCPDALVLEVINPRTPDDAAAGGHGLIGVRERVELHGGTLEVGPEPDGSYRLRARLPRPAP